MSIFSRMYDTIRIILYTQLKFCRTMVVPALLYGRDTWVIGQCDEISITHEPSARRYQMRNDDLRERSSRYVRILMITASGMRT